MESPPGTSGGAQGDGMKHKEQLWGPFLLSNTCNKICGLQSGPASTPNAPRALGTPLRLLVPPCGQATRPQSRCPHSLPRAALLRRPLAAPRGGISVPFLCPPRCPQNPARPLRSPLLLLGQWGARPELPGVSTRGSPNVTKSARRRAPIIVASGRRDMGGPMGTGTLLWGFATRKKALPAAPAPWPGRKPMCFPQFVPGASPNFLAGFWGSPNPNHR